VKLPPDTPVVIGALKAQAEALRAERSTSKEQIGALEQQLIETRISSVEFARQQKTLQAELDEAQRMIGALRVQLASARASKRAAATRPQAVATRAKVRKPSGQATARRPSAARKASRSAAKNKPPAARKRRWTTTRRRLA